MNATFALHVVELHVKAESGSSWNKKHPESMNFSC